MYCANVQAKKLECDITVCACNGQHCSAKWKSERVEILRLSRNLECEWNSWERPGEGSSSMKNMRCQSAYTQICMNLHTHTRTHARTHKQNTHIHARINTSTHISRHRFNKPAALLIWRTAASSVGCCGCCCLCGAVSTESACKLDLMPESPAPSPWLAAVETVYVRVSALVWVYTVCTLCALLCVCVLHFCACECVFVRVRACRRLTHTHVDVETNGSRSLVMTRRVPQHGFLS